MASSAEDRREEPPPPPPPAEESPVTYRTKVIQFFGRSTPIILQNDNGPCPLLAICNVLSLKNKLNLSPDGGDVSQEKLLVLVADRIIDSNSNVDNKDEGYIENQPQNIDDVIGLLHRLTTGIDVNIKFSRIGDFESTTERAIFDLLDIPLYHGWIVDPQDEDTLNAIGSKSYNTLTEELAVLENRNVGSEYNNKEKFEEDCIDFAAATTATLGVPCPCLSRGKSFDDSPRSLSDDHKPRKGDFEEEVELLRALKLSEAEMSTSTDDLHGGNSSSQNLSISNYNNELVSSETVPEEYVYSYLKNDKGNPNGQSNSEESGEQVRKDIVEKNHIVNPLVKSETALFDSSGQDPSSPCETRVHNNGGDERVDQQSTLRGEKIEAEDYSCSSIPNSELDSSSGRINNVDVHETVSSSGEGSSEPIYEGEECVLDSVTKTCQDREPMYEGEVVLAERVGKDGKDAFENISSQDEITTKQGEVIRNFLDSSATQLTVYGLFCLQEDLKENELCVFFRNNHFNTMFKYDGQLYLLATDQGYINQPDLVWEKLNEVNGDTVFMTGDFKEFKIEENHGNTTWDERDAMGNTANVQSANASSMNNWLMKFDHLASINGPDSSFNSDLELAIALQQQEYAQQSQRNSQQQSSSSRLVTGPQVPRNSGKNSSSSSASKSEVKSSKEKCILM